MGTYIASILDGSATVYFTGTDEGFYFIIYYLSLFFLTFILFF